jgi:hypothetical protein
MAWQGVRYSVAYETSPQSRRNTIRELRKQTLTIASYLTRHSSEFDLRIETEIKRQFSPYQKSERSCPDYLKKHEALEKIGETGQFVWAYEKSHRFLHSETFKPIEWELNVSPDRVLGYVDDDRWSKIVKNNTWDTSQATNQSALKECFTTCKPQNTSEFSVLLRFPIFPLRKHENFQTRDVSQQPKFGATMGQRVRS